MKLRSQLPISFLFFKQWLPEGGEVGVVLAKALFRRSGVSPDFVATFAPDLCLEDLFEGDPAWTPLTQEQDIAPGKKGTDLIVHATARSPLGKDMTDWPVAISIPDRLYYGFQVRGPAHWQRGMLGRWRRSAPPAMREVPISYRLAYGGQASGPHAEVAVHQFNPAGTGLVTRERLDLGEDIPLPQIGALAEFEVNDPLHDMTVHGFGPIAKSWMPRRALAGTFDDDWLRERHPRMPLDHDLRFWNAAPSALQFDPPLRGDEHIAVKGIAHDADPIRVKLPAVWCGIELGPTPGFVPMLLDTVVLNLHDADARKHEMTILWRCRVDAPEQFDHGQIVAGRLED